MPAITLDPLNLVLATFASRGHQLTVVQVGACDGVNNDPVREVVSQISGRAILIEPNPCAFEHLQRTYAGAPNVTLVQAAIGEQDGEAYLYRVKANGASEPGADTLQIASFFREHLEKHGKKADQIERITVPCRTLSSLVGEYGLDRIDLLQIDAEGFDAAAVRMALGLPLRPISMNFEHIHLKERDRKPLFELLNASDYLLCYDEWNILAVQKSFLNSADARRLS